MRCAASGRLLSSTHPEKLERRNLRGESAEGGARARGGRGEAVRQSQGSQISRGNEKCGCNERGKEVAERGISVVRRLRRASDAAPPRGRGQRACEKGEQGDCIAASVQRGVKGVCSCWLMTVTTRLSEGNLSAITSYVQRYPKALSNLRREQHSSEVNDLRLKAGCCLKED